MFPLICALINGVVNNREAGFETRSRQLWRDCKAMASFADMEIHSHTMKYQPLKRRDILSDLDNLESTTFITERSEIVGGQINF